MLNNLFTPQQAWAIHRDTYTLPPDYKKLKGNFRCALRKSESFQEIKPDFSTTENHGAEFKVYRVLAAEEVQGGLLFNYKKKLFKTYFCY